MAKPKTSNTGTCALTGNKGRYIRSHLIPRSLTMPRANGQAFAQIGGGIRPIRRRDSWYDTQLVTQDGEDILTEYDTWALDELRKKKLIWQSWGPQIDRRQNPLDDTEFSAVQFTDPIRMRLFLLSLLWRAAATSLREFSEITVRASDLRRLKGYVRDRREPPYEFFPATIIQLSTLGPKHNLSPIAYVRPKTEELGIVIRAEPVFRFYFDGLIIYFYRKPNQETLHGIKPMAVGAQKHIIIPRIPYENSFQKDNLRTNFIETEMAFPGAIARAEGKSR